MFHLLCGETMVTLHDIIMILGLPMDSFPMCGPVSPVGWRDSIGEAIGIRPPDVAVDQKDKKPSGVHSGWLTTHFDTYLDGAKDRVIQRYTRSCLWHMANELLFSNLIQFLFI
jgi:hypothetical protein